MPWLSILMFLISFLAARKGDNKNNAKAALVGTAAGLGTYYVTHDTEWGQENLGSLDGVITQAAVDSEGNVAGSTTVSAPAVDSNGMRVNIPTSPPIPGGSDTTGLLTTSIKSLTPIAQTAGVLGTTVVASSVVKQPWFPWAVGGAILLLLRD